MARRYDWMPDDYRPVPGIDSRSHEGRALYNWWMSKRPGGAASVLGRQPDTTPAEVAADDVHAKLARKIGGNARAVLLYLASRGAVCADTARTRDCIAAGLAAAGVDVSENTPKNAVASLRAQGEAVGLNLVESGDSGSWLPPDGQRVAALVPKPARTETQSASLKVRGG